LGNQATNSMILKRGRRLQTANTAWKTRKMRSYCTTREH